MEEVSSLATWNKKRIVFAIILLILLIIGGLYFRVRVLGARFSLQEKESVKGVSIENKDAENDLGSSIKESIKEKINSLKQEVSNLDILEVASSSPQVQKILNDIKSLEQYPTNQIKEICRKICGL
jgi:hypothetical protein